jgi:hypothetical protein
MPPAAPFAFDQAKVERGERQPEQSCAYEIEAASVALACLGQVPPDEERCGQAQGEVDEERPAPAEVGDEPTADDRAERRDHPDHRSPDAEGDQPLPTLERGVDR